MLPPTSSTPPVEKHRHRRTQEFESSLPENESTPITVVTEGAETLSISEAVLLLPKLERTIIELHHQHGMTFSQVGEILGCTEDKVVCLWVRALNRIGCKFGSLVNG